jgi:methyltransferase (TIGR00027 family)
VTGGDIDHVADTALWVAHYRALESQRPDALFHDRLAGMLVGERGPAIAAALDRAFRYIHWSVVMRTSIIDRLVRELVGEGVDTVVNLGAGLDTRPYRLGLPASLRWVEVDYPSVIAHKENALRAETPGVKLERIALDLSDVGARDALFARLGGESRKALILTEGVIPYLTEDQVASLAASLHAQGSFRFWIAEYFAPQMYRHFRSRERTAHLRNAPFRFFPTEWFAFFRAHGWAPREVAYLAEESMRVGRPMPLPLWARLMLKIAPADKVEAHRRLAGFAVYTKIEGQERP